MVSIVNNATNLLVYPKLSTCDKRAYSPSTSVFLMIKIITILPYFVIPLIFLCIDSLTLSFLHVPLFQTAAVGTLVFFLCGPFPLLTPWFLVIVGLFSSLCTGHFFSYPLCVTGILLLAKGTTLYTNHLSLVIIGASAIISLVSAYLLEIPLTPSYTIICLAGNLGSTYISLKWFSAVKRGNRS